MERIRNEMTSLPPIKPGEYAIFRFFAKQKIFVNLIVLLVFIMGGYFALNSTKEAFPHIDFDLVVIGTSFPGATAEETEQLVTAPIEKVLKSVDGIDQMDSVSVEGRSQIILRLDPDYPDKRKLVKEIEQEVERVRNSELPEDGNEPLVEELSSNRPVLIAGISGSVDEEKLRAIARELEDEFREIPGVGRINKFGYREREIWVEADQQRLDTEHLSLLELIRAVRMANHISPGGRMELDGREVLVRALGKLETAQDVKKVIVRSNEEGLHLRVENIAKTSETLQRERNFTQIFGTRAIRLVVMKKTTGDSLKIAKEVKQITQELKKKFPREIEIKFYDDTTFFIKRRLNVLINNGIQGMILVLLVLFFFLSPYSALWTTMAIPFSYMGGLIIMHFLGYTINLITLFSFILVLGMLVDDGIVVSEYTERKREEGYHPFTAASLGVSRMALPLIATVLTTIVAFLPLAFVSGMIGKFLREFPAVIVAILIVDLLECLFILPSHLAYFHSFFQLPERIKKIQAFGPKIIRALETRYAKAIRWCISHPLKVLIFFLALLGTVAIVSRIYLKFHMFPVDVDEFKVSYELPVGKTLEETEKAARKIEEALKKIPAVEIDSVITDIGFLGEEERLKRGAHLGQSRVVLDTSGKRKRSGRAILESVRPELEQLKDKLGIVSLELRQRRAGPPTGRSVEVRLIGEDFHTLHLLSESAQKFLSKQKGVFGVSDDFEEGKEELRLVIDRDLAARAGISISEIAQVVRAAFEGEKTTVIKRAELDEDIQVLVKLPESARKDPSTLKKVKVSNSRGRLIPLSQLARFENQKSLLAIQRSEGKRAITVNAELDQKITSSAEVNKNLGKFLKELFKDYPGYKFIFYGEEKDRIESMRSLLKAMGVAVLLNYMLLATLFQSFARPFIILSVVPFAFIGVFLTLLLHGLPLSILVLIGLTGLIGVVVNNSILMVDTIHGMRQEHGDKSLDEILVQSAVQRLRPILLTSVTTFLGVLPLGYGIGGKEPFLQHVALTFGWGLLFAAGVTLFLVPSLYALLVHIREKALRYSSATTE